MQKANFDPSLSKNLYMKISAMLLFLSSLLLPTIGQADYSVGVVKFTYGDVTIASSSGETRKAKKDDDLMKNELIVTGAASIAVIQLNDDSRMTLRPLSRFRVTKLVMDEDDSSKQNAVLNLLRGGLRLITGLIGKENPSGYRLNTPVATIGIRGTEFNTRLCTTDCAAEEKKYEDSVAASKIEEGLYVNVDDGRVYLENFADGEPLDLQQGESGYISDLSSIPVKLSFIPAFMSLDKIPSPSQLDFDDIEISDDDLEEIEKEAKENNSSTNEGADNATGLNIAGDWETDDVEYGVDLPLAARNDIFGSSPDLEFSLNQKGNKFEGEFEGDRDGIIKGAIDDNKATFTFELEGKRGEIKDGSGFWIIKDDDTLEGEFLVRDRDHGIVRGFWTLERD